MSQFMASIIDSVSKSPLLAFASIRRSYNFENIMTRLEIFCKTLRYYETKTRTGFGPHEWRIFCESYHHRETSKILRDEGLKYENIAEFIHEFLANDHAIGRCEFIRHIKSKRDTPSEWLVNLRKLSLKHETDGEKSETEGYYSTADAEEQDNTAQSTQDPVDLMSFDDDQLVNFQPVRESTKIRNGIQTVVQRKLEFADCQEQTKSKQSKSISV